MRAIILYYSRRIAFIPRNVKLMGGSPLIEVFVAAIVLGLTAGLCPICLLFALPILPHIASKCRNMQSAVLEALKFSTGVAIVFVPLGVLVSWAVELTVGDKGALAYLVAGMISMFVGLLALRIIKISYGKICKTVNLRLLGSSIFAYGLSYGLATLGRGAPLLFSILSIVAVYGNVPLGAIALAIYAFCMGTPLIIFAAIMGITKLRRFITQNSRKLDAVSGILLLFIGSYYLWMFSSLIMR